MTQEDDIRALDASIEEMRRVTTQHRLILELYMETSVYWASGRPTPPALTARLARQLREMDTAAATHQRDLLQREAGEGNEYAVEVLELVADDPWWRGR